MERKSALKKDRLKPGVGSNQQQLIQVGIRSIHDLLDDPQFPQHPEFIAAELHGDDIDITVLPNEVGQLVKLRLHIVSAAIIKPRRRR